MSNIFKEMSNIFKGINIKNHTYYFFDDIINTKYFNPNNIKKVQKSYKNIFVSYVRYLTIKDLKYVKLNSVNL